MIYKSLAVFFEVSLIAIFYLSGLHEMKIGEYFFLYRYCFLMLFVWVFFKKEKIASKLFYVNILYILVAFLLFFFSGGKIIGSECRFKNYKKSKVVEIGKNKTEVDEILGKPFYDHQLEYSFDAYYDFGGGCMYYFIYKKRFYCNQALLAGKMSVADLSTLKQLKVDSICILYDGEEYEVRLGGNYTLDSGEKYSVRKVGKW